MKDRLWNTLSVFGLVSICVVIAFVLLLFVSPNIFLNPFPPPTKVPLVVIPTEDFSQTSTPTMLGLPATWTITVNTRPSATLFPSSTPIPTRTIFRLPTSTYTQTVTRTRTVTRTPTRTPTRTRTRTRTLTTIPSETLTPTDTVTPTITETPTETETPTPTSTDTEIPPP